MQAANVALNPGHKPREPRQKVVISARMRVGAQFSDVCIRDISSRGMMLQAASPPAPGTYIEIYRATHMMVARVVWARDRRFGIQTQDRMNVAAIVSASAATPSGPRLPDQERRSGNRPAVPSARDIAMAAERSQNQARAFQFSLMVACGLLGAGLLGSFAYDMLASPFDKAASHFAITG